MEKSKAIRLLQRQIDKGRMMIEWGPPSQQEYRQWEVLTETLLRNIYGDESKEIEDVFQKKVARVSSSGAGESAWERFKASELKQQLSGLRALVESLALYMELELDEGVAPPSATGNRIFLVHGQNEGIKHNVARFLEGLEQEIIILDEQPNEGQTIIEKFEKYSDVGFAIVLLTGDDKGAPLNASSKWQLRRRARQNVIFELGYFLGRLGRNRVCALYEEGVELPSDFSGVLYILLDKGGGWKQQLGKELSGAGFKIDMNRAR